MIPSSFDYTAPDSIEAALAALSEAGDDGKVLAGGQSLVPVLRLRMAAPGMLVDLRKIRELTGVRLDGGDVVIGAMTTHHEVVNDPIVGEHLSLLSKTAATVADPQVRHRGTLGGALVHADPAGDLGAVAVALDAVFEIVGPNGRRSVPAAEFFRRLLHHRRAENELLVSVRFPSFKGWGAHYEKFTRVAQSWSIVSVAAAIKVSDGVVSEARVGSDQHGPDTDPGGCGRGCACRRPRHRRGDQGRGGLSSGRDLAGGRHVGRRRLPRAPGPGPDRTGGVGRRRLTSTEDRSGSRVNDDSGSATVLVVQPDAMQCAARLRDGGVGRSLAPMYCAHMTPRWYAYFELALEETTA